MTLAVSKTGRLRRHDALSALRREAIVQAAIRLFGRKGFASTRAEDIAAAAGIAKGTVYLYFKNKEAIYLAAVAEAIKALQAEIAARTPAEGGFRAKLTAAIRVRLEFWPEHEGIYRLLLTVGREPRLRRQTNEVIRAAQTGLLRIFEEGALSGEIPQSDFSAAAWAVLDMVRGATERRMDRLSPTSPGADAVWITACILRQVEHPDLPLTIGDFSAEEPAAAEPA